MRVHTPQRQPTLSEEERGRVGGSGEGGGEVGTTRGELDAEVGGEVEDVGETLDVGTDRGEVLSVGDAGGGKE